MCRQRSWMSLLSECGHSRRCPLRNRCIQSTQDMQWRPALQVSFFTTVILFWAENSTYSCWICAHRLGAIPFYKQSCTFRVKITPANSSQPWTSNWPCYYKSCNRPSSSARKGTFECKDVRLSYSFICLLGLSILWLKGENMRNFFDFWFRQQSLRIWRGGE